MNLLEIERCCAECGQRLAGRSDKKFCNDQCRTSWHNRQAKRVNQFFWNPPVVYLLKK